MHAVLVGLDHLLDHLAADGTGLTAGKVTVITVLQIDTDLRGRFHLETIHSLTGVRVHKLVTGIGGHTNTPFHQIGIGKE